MASIATAMAATEPIGGAITDAVLRVGMTIYMSRYHFSTTCCSLFHGRNAEGGVDCKRKFIP